MSQQQISLGYLFLHVAGGYYIIEDVHTSLPRYATEYGVEADEKNTTLSLLNGFVRGEPMASRYLSKEENAFLTEQIDSVTVSARSHLVDKRNDGIPSIMAIVKRRAQPAKQARKK